MEKNLKWYYGQEGPQDVGPNDPIHQKFKGNPYYSIVRESIQNSLDALNNNSEPVHVNFSYFELGRREFPELFSIDKHIALCKDYFPKNDQAQKMLDEMLSYLNGQEMGKNRLKIPCLKISDFNTQGMSYKKHDTNSRFYSFFKVSGLSTKNVGAGGSFGFGKGAYYALSPIKTILVSTMDMAGNHFFEGSTRLTTHLDESGTTKFSAYGYYDKGDGEPVAESEEIPKVFRRFQTGTDVFIIGLQEDLAREKNMVLSVLNNFWLAIYDNELTVTIDNTAIEQSNLEKKIEEFFPNQLESSSANDYERWNPWSYFKAVKYSRQSPQFRNFSKSLPTLGEVNLMVYTEKKLPDRVAFLRKPKMVVFKKTNKKLNGYSAVFTCINKKGNEILRRMENPEHNEWKKENYLKDGRPHIDALKAEIEIRDFISEVLNSLSGSETSKKQSFLGLEEYLSIPEDLIGSDEDVEGDASTLNYGQKSNEISTEETAVVSTEKSEIIINPIKSRKPKVLEEFDAEILESGEEIISTSTNNGGGGGDKPVPAPSNDFSKGEKGEKKTKRAVPIKFRVIAQPNEKGFMHTLLIDSENDVNNAELEISVGTDNDSQSSDNALNVKESSKGSCSGNKITDFRLLSGKNKIEILFEDHRKHALRVKAYEI